MADHPRSPRNFIAAQPKMLAHNHFRLQHIFTETSDGLHRSPSRKASDSAQAIGGAMTRATATALVLLLASPSDLIAVDAHKAAYAGGTIARLNASKARIPGHVDLNGADHMLFVADRRPHAHQPLRIQYAAIQDLEFGQRAGRRVATAVAATALFGSIGLMTLSSKRRVHYLTIAYADPDGTNQVAIFELGKGIVRPTLATLEERSGKAVEYQNEEARKWSR
jgi:hypothetical protein